MNKKRYAIATMEQNNANAYQKYDHEEEDDDQDTISLSNFPNHDDDDEEEESDLNQVNNNTSPDQDIFEFFTNPSKTPQITPTNHQIVFCGKIIEEHDLSQPPIPSFGHFNRSVSFRDFHPKLTATTAVTNSAAAKGSLSRRRPCTFGLVKFPPEMKLNDIRRRQSRRPPAPMFAAVEDGDREPAMVSVSGCGRRGGGWGGGLLRTLRSRSHLCSVFAKTSLGCISLV